MTIKQPAGKAAVSLRRYRRGRHAATQAHPPRDPGARPDRRRGARGHRAEPVSGAGPTRHRPAARRHRHRGTMTLNLLTGAATADFTGHLSPLGAETGHDDLTLTPTGASTFSYTGTRTFVAANGDKLFSAITGSGTFTRTTAHSTETDTITGGTGRFAGASGTYQETVSSVVVSVTATSQTSRVTGAARGQIRY